MTVGVIIQNYNYGCFLEDAIKSVLWQTYQPDELFVIDDCSTKFIVERDKIIKKYGIKLIKNKYNLGCPETLNKAVRLLNTDYICCLSADDYFGTSNYLIQMKYCLDDNSNVGIAYCDFILMQENGINIVTPRPEFDPATIMQGNYIHGSSMFRKICFEQAGGYKNIHHEDWQLWIDIAKNDWLGKRAPNIYLNYRKHNLGNRNKGDDK